MLLIILIQNHNKKNYKFNHNLIKILIKIIKIYKILNNLKKNKYNKKNNNKPNNNLTFLIAIIKKKQQKRNQILFLKLTTKKPNKFKKIKIKNKNQIY